MNRQYITECRQFDKMISTREKNEDKTVAYILRLKRI